MIRFALYLVALMSLPVLAQSQDTDIDRFKRAWNAARQGNRAEFEQIKQGMQAHVLYPYLQYEDFRFRRRSAPASDVAAFLDAHSDWAFTPGLRRAWLRSLGEGGRWDDLLTYASAEPDTEVRCYLAQARIHRAQTDDLQPQAQSLWTVGQSQPEACDPVFAWLIKEKGITQELAWLRIRRAMEARNPRLTLYLSRFIHAQDRVWVERWQQQEVERYTRLDRARNWPDQDEARDITQFGLEYLARRDADRAWKVFGSLDGRIQWGPDRRGAILREIALRSALSMSPDAIKRLQSVPPPARDDNLLEWWTRFGLATGRWSEAIGAIAAMSEASRNSDRWRYWDAIAHQETGQAEYARDELLGLAREAGYYGFLAADHLGLPYFICPEQPQIDAEELRRFAERSVLRRIIELDAVGLNDWKRQEWGLALNRMSREELRLAAALAVERGWSDFAILALAKSGDRNWYEWRFPLAFVSEVKNQAERRGLDLAWVMGLLRSESAMAADATSTAGAQGLMQVSPGTAAQVARRNGYTYRGGRQLLEIEDNILFGTTFLRELMDRFKNNPVLALGAYNAGPAAVERWLKNLPARDPAIWIESLPYFETRDYIPRVLAFSTIYEWRLQLPVKRITSRMPTWDSGNMTAMPGTQEAVQISCPAPATPSTSGR